MFVTNIESYISTEICGPINTYKNKKTIVIFNATNECVYGMVRIESLISLIIFCVA